MSQTNPVVHTYQPDNLIAGDFPILTEAIPLAASLELTRGTVLGKITATGKYTPSLSEATDGSQAPVTVLFEDVITGEEGGIGIGMLTGEVLSDELTIGTGHTVASVTAALRPLSIFVR